MKNPHRHEQELLALVREVRERLVAPIGFVVGVFVLGVGGYVALGEGRWSAFDAAYMTTITMTTIGYGEVLSGMDGMPVARAFTMLLAWLGFMSTVYAGSTVTAFVVQRNLGRLLRERRLRKMLENLKDHFIVCGAGFTGHHILQELITTQRPCVVLELDAERANWLRERHPDTPILVGDATDEEVLKRAGVDRAAGVFANVRDDSRNLLITVQARFANARIRIVARAQDNHLIDKFKRAGADFVINPTFIGGLRMASQMLRPNTVTFLDKMLRGQDASTRVDEAEVHATSPLVGKTLAASRITERTGLTVIGMREPNTDAYHYNVQGDAMLAAGTVLFVIGNPEQLSRLRQLCATG